MGNETNFISKKILIFKEDVIGQSPATIAKAFAVKMLNFGLTEAQKKETNPTLGNGGQAPSTDYGSSDFSGSLECKYTGGIMPILLHHAIGSGTKANATVDTWGASAVVVAGDIVNGVANPAYSYVCKVGGTTAGTEPTITTEVDGDEITDGTVTWILRPLLKSYTGSKEQCVETIGVESVTESNCSGVTSTFKERYNGVFINGLEFAKSAGTVIFKYSLPVLATNRIDSENSSFSELTITTEEEIIDNAFGYEEMKVEVGGVELSNIRSFSLSVNNNITIEDGVKQGEKINNAGIPTVDGELGIKFTKEEYTLAYNNSKRGVVVTYSKANGDSVVLTFPTVEFQRSPLSYATNEPIYLSVPLNATGSASVATLSYTCISGTDY